MAHTLSIGDVSAQAGLNTSAVRYYERVGLLPAARRVSGRRVYPPSVLERLRAIAVAKQAGFSLPEIRILLSGFSPDMPPSARWQALAERKLAEVDALVARAQAMRALLQRGLDCQCLSLTDCDVMGAEGGPPPG